MTCATLAWLALAGCAPDEDGVRRDVEFLAQQEGDAVRPALDRVARRGRAALPSLESALHTAGPRGRRNLVLALAAVDDRGEGDGEAVPLLRHLARFDDASEVRAEAERALRSWSMERGAGSVRAARAAEALRTL